MRRLLRPDRPAIADSSTSPSALHVSSNVRTSRTIDFTPSVAAARRDALDMLMHGQQFGFIDRAADVMGLVDRVFVPVIGFNKLPIRSTGP
jgi:hypothetical protein